MSKKYEKTLLHHIYAIIEPDTKSIYIGKTTINNPHKKRKNTISGKISSVDGEFSDKCKYLLLESLYISKEEAFKHILAWYRFFENNGYEVLVKDKAAVMLEFPKETTKTIYKEFCLPYSVKEVLEREVIPLKKDEEKEEVQTEQYPFTQLNIRVREDVANSFRIVSKRFGLSQNDTLKLLMMEKDDVMKISIASEICDLKQKLHIYEEQHKQNRKDKLRALRKQKNLVEILKNSINLFTNHLEKLNYADREKIIPQKVIEDRGNQLFHSYPYPETIGCCLATLEEIVLGKYNTSEFGKVTTTKFLLLKTLNGEKIKLRLFGQKEFIGCYPIQYAYKGSLWIVGYTISEDKGTNMVLGIPIDSIYKKSAEDESSLFEEKDFTSLEDIISMAENISENNW